MAKTIEYNIELIDSVTDVTRQIAASLGNVNKAIAHVSQSFENADNSLQGFVGKISSINQLSKAFSGVYTVVTAQNEALKSDVLEWVFDKTGEVCNTILSIKSAYDAMVGVYAQLASLTSLQTTATAVTKLWNKATDQAIYNALTRLPLGLTATTIGMKLYMAVAVPATMATYAFSAALKSVSKAIYSIPVVGWILAIVAAVIALVTMVVTAFEQLWDSSMQFREILFGVWEVIKLFATGIAHFFVGIWQNITGFLSGVWASILSFFSSIWQNIIGIFSPFTSWIATNVIQPVKILFSGLWEHIYERMNNAMNKLKGVFAPIRALWNKLFGKVSDAYETGEAKGQDSFKKDQEKKKQATKPKPAEEEAVLIPTIVSPGNGGSLVNSKIDAMGTDSGKVTNTYITLGSLVESITIQSANISEGVSDIRDIIVKTLLEVLNGQNVAGAKY